MTLPAVNPDPGSAAGSRVGPVVGIVGGGQLARMMCHAAAPLDLRVRVLAADAGESASSAATELVLGDHRDAHALREFAKQCNVLTFDHEHVPPAILEELATAGVHVRPGPGALVSAQDKSLMREKLGSLGLPIPRWAVVHEVAELERFAESVGGWPVILKASRGGYDGKGVWRIDDAAHARRLMGTSATGLVAEELVPFVRELAAQVARRPSGDLQAYPVVETVQIDGICREVVAPARISSATAQRARDVAIAIAEALDVTGMLAVELFELPDGEVLVNELAMRPHNSGHWTIDGASTSQFEQHLRAVSDLPLGPPQALAPYAVMVNLLGGSRTDLAEALPDAWAAEPGLRVHLYGKSVRPGRKVGHVTLLGDDPEDLLRRGRAAAALLTEVDS